MSKAKYMHGMSVRQRNRSLLVSLFLHALLVLFCFYFSLRMRHHLPYGPDDKTQKIPARVSFVPAAPYHGTSHQGIQNVVVPPDAQPILQIKRKSVPVQSAQPQQQLTQTAVQTVARPVNSATQEEQSRRKNLPDAVADESTDMAIQPELEQSARQAGQAAGQETGPHYARDSERSEVTSATFMNAWHSAVRAEQAHDEGRRQTIRPNNQQIPAHVEERLAEWHYAHYRQRISHAMIKNAHMFRKFVQTPRDIETRLYFTLIIDEEGNLKNNPTYEMTGAEEIDQCIREFFASVEFPPIPKRMKLKEFPIRVMLQLTLVEGGCMFHLKPMN